MDISTIFNTLSPFFPTDEVEETEDASEEDEFINLVTRFISYDPLSTSINILLENEEFISTLIGMSENVDLNGSVIPNHQSILKQCFRRFPHLSSATDTKELLI